MPDYGNRADLTPKGLGYFGELYRPGGGLSTELSIGVNMDGKEMEIPLLVPTLSNDEIKHLLGGGEPSLALVDKAVAHARQRMATGMNPFAQRHEVAANRDPDFMQQYGQQLIGGGLGALRRR